MTTIVEAIAARLKAQVGEDNILDVGKNTAELLGVPKTKLLAAVKHLCDTEGYKTYYMPIYQGGGLKTTVKVLARPGSKFVDIYNRIGEVQPFKPETTRKEIAAVGAASKKTDIKLARVLALNANGYSNVAIGKTLGLSESTIRRWIKSA